MFHHRFGRFKAKQHETRGQMIAETSAFLSRALRERGSSPRIPRRRVKDGGFTTLLRVPGARAAMTNWWHRVLDQLA